jgi:diguanylate cyclase (GGDEF)-like protein
MGSRLILGVDCTALRGTDTFARFGGEEFAVIFPETSPQAACEVLERIRTVMATRVWSSLPDG